MGYHKFTFHPDLNYDIQKLAVVSGIARLRKIDSLFNFDPAGNYYEAFIDTDNWQAKGIEKFVGIVLEADIPSGTDVKFQVSVDNGATFLYWNGVSWVVASGTDRNTVQEISDGLQILHNSFVGVKQLKLRLFLETDGKATPFVKSVFIYALIRMSYWDDLASSLHNYITNNVSALLSHSLQSDLTTSTLTISNLNHNVFDIVGVWNHTQDPGHVQNLLSGWTLSGQDLIINLSQNVNAGDYVWIDFLGITKSVIVKFADPLFTDTVLPSILIVPTATRPHRYQESIDFDIGLDTKKDVYLFSQKESFLSSTVWVVFASNNAQETFQLLNSSLEFLDDRHDFTSLATGEKYHIIGYNVQTDTDIVSSNISIKRLILTISGRNVFYQSVEVPKIKQIVVGIGSTVRKDLEFVIS